MRQKFFYFYAGEKNFLIRLRIKNFFWAKPIRRELFFLMQKKIIPGVNKLRQKKKFVIKKKILLAKFFLITNFLRARVKKKSLAIFFSPLLVFLAPKKFCLQNLWRQKIFLRTTASIFLFFKNKDPGIFFFLKKNFIFF